jgi:hypothetical protein
VSNNPSTEVSVDPAHIRQRSTFAGFASATGKRIEMGWAVRGAAMGRWFMLFLSF